VASNSVPGITQQNVASSENNVEKKSKFESVRLYTAIARDLNVVKRTCKCQGRIQRGDLSDIPPKNYENNFIHHDFYDLETAFAI